MRKSKYLVASRRLLNGLQTQSFSAAPDHHPLLEQAVDLKNTRCTLRCPHIQRLGKENMEILPTW